VKNYTSIIASFLLLLFTAAQISVVHEFAHDDEESIECSVCIVAQEFQSQSFDTSLPVSYDLAAPVIIKHDVVAVLAFVKADSHPSIHTTRPPPFS
jgi:hypothetical protein